MTAAVATSATSEVRDRILAASRDHAPVRIAGAGTWLDAGRPVEAPSTLSLEHDTGIVEYVAGDLTLTARAGTSLSEIARVTAAEHQWLVLDPFGAPNATLGATIATGSCGPLSHAYGRPRDHVLGVEYVTGTGSVVRAGGRVVKNVAGFDLTRLVTGAWGTLGVLTELTVRLRALPEEDVTLAVPVGSDALDDTLAWMRGAPLAPLAAELVSGALASRLVPDVADGARTILLVRIGGNAALVRASRAALSARGPVTDVQASTWDALRASDPPGSPIARWSARPAALGTLWRDASALATRFGGHAHATVSRGVARIVLPPAAGADALHELTRATPAHRVVIERLPRDGWSTAPASADDRISRALRDAFDPQRLLNPGILGERIS